VRQIEFTRRVATFSPIENIRTVCGELDYTAVAIPIRHEELAVRCNGYVGRLIEMRRIQPGFLLFTKRQQQIAVVSEFVDLMVARVGYPDVVVVINLQAMRVDEHTLPER
jgi:hypothetical protein